MALPTDQTAQEQRPLSRTEQARTPSNLRLLCLGLVTVAFLYALPLVLAYVRQGRLSMRKLWTTPSTKPALLISTRGVLWATPTLPIIRTARGTCQNWWSELSLAQAGSPV